MKQQTELTTITIRLPKQLKSAVLKAARNPENEQDVSKYMRGLIFRDLTSKGVKL